MHYRHWFFTLARPIVSIALLILYLIQYLGRRRQRDYLGLEYDSTLETYRHPAITDGRRGSSYAKTQPQTHPYA